MLVAGVPPIYRRELPMCQCGATSTTEHRIWVGWVPSGEYASPIGQLINWLATLATGSTLVHCQLIFRDAQNQTFYTYSVDRYVGAVYVWHLKSFSSDWRIVELRVTEAQELAARNFLVRQLGKPVNTVGLLLWPFGGASGNGESWFCSELVTEALALASLIDLDEWGGAGGVFPLPHTIAPHQLYDYFTTPGRCTTSAAPRLLSHNPMMVAALVRQIAAAEATGSVDPQARGTGLVASAPAILPSLLGENVQFDQDGKLLSLRGLSIGERAAAGKRPLKKKKRDRVVPVPQPQPSLLSMLRNDRPPQ
jgi:hypothetical protein